MADGTQDFRHLSTILTNATNTIWAPVNATNSTTYVPNGVGFFAIFKNTLVWIWRRRNNFGANSE
jgi:hypothetical protein